MSLISYSAITTKIRAMQSRLISDEQLQVLAGSEDVRSAADFLKQQPAYADIFSDLDDTRLHRANIEQLLTLSEYRDFAKLYRFSNVSQRRFLDLYFMQYEIDVVKQVLRNVLSRQKTVLNLSIFRDFFNRHASIDLVALSQSENLTDFLAHLEGSAYYNLLAPLSGQNHAALFDYEMALDLYYFKTIWKIKNKILSRNEQKLLDACFGCRLDLLNLQWIYRAKKYYRLAPSDIYALLIPVNYKLCSTDISRLAEAPGMEEFFAVLKGTWYGSTHYPDLNEKPDPELLYHEILNRIYANAGRRHPYSIAILDSYLFLKKREKRRIITILEGIRYGLSSGEILALTAKQ